MGSDAEPAVKAQRTVGGIVIGMGIFAFLLAIMAAFFGQSIKPLGEIADGLTLWHLIAALLVALGIGDIAVGAYMLAQARRAIATGNPGPKR